MQNDHCFTKAAFKSVISAVPQSFINELNCKLIHNLIPLFFSFVVNPLAPVQETLCLLQNDTTAHNPSAVPQKAASMYYMVKLHIRSGKCVKIFLLSILLTFASKNAFTVS